MKPSKPTSHAAIWQIAWPMMLSGMSVPLLGLVDTALLGHLDSAKHLGAVAIGANIIGLLYWSFGFLRMSTTGLTAMAVGKTAATSAPSNDTEHAFDTDGIVFRALVLGLGLGVLISVSASTLSTFIIQLMQASETITPLALEYIEIRKFSAPAVLMTFAISGWLIGQKLTRQALMLVLTTNIINIILDVGFIAFLGWEAKGAARATLCAEWLGLLLGVFFLCKHSRILSAASRRYWASYIKLHAIKPMLAMNLHLLARTMLLMTVLNFFTAQGSVHGETILAANAILLQLVLLSAYVIDGFSFAAEVLCGQAHGAGNTTKVNRTLRQCMQWAGGSACLFGVAYWLVPDLIVGMLTNLPAVSDTSLQYMGWAIVITGVGFIAYIMDGVCIGTNKTTAMNIAMCVSALLVFFPAWWVLQPFGNDGLWLAFLLFTVSRGVTLGGYWWFLQRRNLGRV